MVTGVEWQAQLETGQISAKLVQIWAGLTVFDSGVTGLCILVGQGQQGE